MIVYESRVSDVKVVIAMSYVTSRVGGEKGAETLTVPKSTSSVAERIPTAVSAVSSMRMLVLRCH